PACVNLRSGIHLKGRREEMTVTVGSGPGTGTGAGDLPTPDILAAAQSRQLGAHVTGRRINYFVAAVWCLLGAALALVLAIAVAALGNNASGIVVTLLRSLALLGCFAFASALGIGLAALVRGIQSFHLFAGGLVYRKYGRTTAVSWPEVAELRPVVGKRGAAAGKVQQYQLALHNGRSVTVPLVVINGRDEFMDQLMAVLQHNGIPVR